MAASQRSDVKGKVGDGKKRAETGSSVPPRTGRYHRYKNSTKIFASWLCSVAPSMFAKAVGITAGIIEAATAVVAQEAPHIPPNVLAHLDSSISLRQEMARACHGVDELSDRKHKYFIDTLCKARDILRTIQPSPCTIPRRAAAPASSNGAFAGAKPDTNPFGVLADGDREEQRKEKDDEDRTDEDQEDEGDEGDVCPGVDAGAETLSAKSHDDFGTMVLFEDPQQDVEISTMCFLLDFSELVEEVARAWSDLAGKSIGLLAATAITNACVMKVAQLHRALSLELSHVDVSCLSSIISAANLVDLASGDVHAKATGISALFGPNSIVATMLMGVQSRAPAVRKALGPGKPWLWPNEPFMSPAWDEASNRFGRLEEFPLSSMMWVQALVSLAHMEKNMLTFDPSGWSMPLWKLTQDLDTEKPEPPALTFAIHAMVMSIFYVQGSKKRGFPCRQIKQMVKNAISVLLLQIDRDQESALAKIQDRTKHNLKQARKIVNLRHEAGRMAQVNLYGPTLTMQFSRPELERQFQRTRDDAFFNPWAAGQQLLHVAHCSLELGTNCVDNLAQTRTVLHIYHALRKVGAIETPVELLDIMIKRLLRSKSLWPVGLPQAGGFCTSWLLAFGHSASSAREHNSRFIKPWQERWKASGASAARRAAMMGKRPNRGRRGPALGDTRRMQPILSADLCESHRLVIEHDFGHLGRGGGDDVGCGAGSGFRRRVDAIRASYSRDSSFLGINLTALGAFFVDLIDQLCVALDLTGVATKLGGVASGKGKGWRESIKNKIWHTKVNLLVCAVLGRCDLAPKMETKDIRDVMLAARTVVKAFESLPRCRYRFFFPCEHCGREATKRCARCKKRYYCGDPECQKRHWKEGGHKAACGKEVVIPN